MIYNTTHLVHKYMHIVKCIFVPQTTQKSDLWLSSESEPSHQALAAGSDMEHFQENLSTCYFSLNWLVQSLTAILSTTRE